MSWPGKRDVQQVLGLALIAAALFGCGTTSIANERWVYSGPDATLRFTARVAPDTSPSEAARRYREYEEVWRQKIRDSVEAAKDACARETGESKSPGFWMGYSNHFLACMKTRGWSRGGGI